MATDKNQPDLNASFSEQENLLRKIGHLFQGGERLALDAPSGDAFLSSALVGEKPGDQVDQYRLTRRLGEGGFGVVFEAEQQSPVKRLVALKIIKAGMDTREVIVRFEAERQTQAMMEHPNIAKVFDAGATKSGRPYFVMELIHGVPITQYCNEQRYGIRERLRLLASVCQAVHHAHQKGVIHRDLKPSNILIVEQGDLPVPKIIDFGIAKATCPERALHSLLTREQRIMGTPAYMSPEQAGIDRVDIDVRSDVYSLGVVAFELLTGRLPFEKHGVDVNVSGEEVLRSIREDTVPRPSTRLVALSEKERTMILKTRSVTPEALGRQLRGDLDWVILKALAKEVDRRYDSCLAFAKDLENYLNQRPVSAVAPSSWDRFTKLVRRNKAAFIAIGAISAVLVFATVISTRQAIRATQAEEVASNEARWAQNVSEFLYRDVLEQANPLIGARNITLREVLDRNVGKIDQRFHDQPQVLAELKWIIGRTYAGLTEFEQAEPLLLDAIELQKKVRGHSNGKAMAAMESLGWLYMLQGRLEEAEQLQLEVLALRRQHLGARNVGVVTSMNQLGEILKKRGDLDAARQWAEDAVGMATGILGQNDQVRVAALLSLGTILAKQRQVEKAERCFKEILELRGAAAMAPADFVTLGALGGLGNLYTDHGRSQEAEPLLRQVLELQRKMYGENSHNALNALHNLAVTTFHLGRSDEAFAMAKESADRSRELVGARHPNTLKFMGTTAFLAVEMGDMAMAEKLWKETLEGQLETLGEEHFETLMTALNLGQFYQDDGRPADARAHYVRCVEQMPSQRELLDALEEFVIQSANDDDPQPREQQFIDILTQLINRKPGVSAWHSRRAEFLGRLQQWVWFEEEITIILQLDPSEDLGFIEKVPLSIEEKSLILRRQSQTRDAVEDREAGAVWDAAQVVSLIPRGSDWHYLDTGEFPGDHWREETFPDGSWSEGAAPLGYGEADLQTEVRSGDSGQRHATTYFRRSFEAKPHDIQALKLRVRWDDGVAVTINGREVYRENLAPEASFQDFASGKVGGSEETAYHVTLVDPGLLKRGANLIAVELHQCDATSSDVVFDLELESLRKSRR